MPDIRRDRPEDAPVERGSTPDNWPGIPGRSAEHDSNDERGHTDVAESQRKLESDVKKTLDEDEES